MLILSRKRGETIVIGDTITISGVDIKGDQVKLGIAAPGDVKVFRQEVYKAIQEENRAAAAVSNIPDFISLDGIFKKKE